MAKKPFMERVSERLWKDIIILQLVGRTTRYGPLHIHIHIPRGKTGKATACTFLGLCIAGLAAVLWTMNREAGWLVVPQEAFYLLLYGGFLIIIGGFVLLCFAASERKQLLVVAGCLVIFLGFSSVFLTYRGRILGNGMVSAFSYQGSRLTVQQVNLLSGEAVGWLEEYNRLSEAGQQAAGEPPEELIKVLELYDEVKPGVLVSDAGAEEWMDSQT